jgi:hypothetical protein
MKCRRINKLITLYVNGDANEKESKIVEEHIKNCPDCALAFKQYKKLTQTIASLEFKECPQEDLDEIWKRISIALDEQEEIKQSRKILKAPFPYLLRNYNFARLRKLVSPPVVASLIILVIIQSFFIGKLWQDRPRKLTKWEMRQIKGGSIPPASILKTSPWNTLSTALDNKNRLKINKNTSLKIWEGDKEYTLKLEKGELWLSCEDSLKKFKVETPLGKVEAKEAEFYVKLDKEERITVTVNYGIVLFNTNNGESKVYAGTQSFATLKTSPSEPEDITIHKATEWVRW